MSIHQSQQSNGQAPSGSPQAYAGAQPSMNVLAVVSLIGGIIGFNVIAVICGHIAMRQIRRTGERGLPLAIIGTILGYLALVALVVFVVLAVVGGAVGIFYGQR